MVKADRVQDEMLDRIEVRSGHIMSDICMQHCACNGCKLPYTSIKQLVDEGTCSQTHGDAVT
jgi:hypothetical protein